MMNHITAKPRKRTRRRSGEEPAAPPECISQMLDEYPELKLDQSHKLDGGSDYVFIQETCDDEIVLPADLPYLLSSSGETAHIMIPVETELPEYLSANPEPVLNIHTLGKTPSTHIPQNDWPSYDEIASQLLQFRKAKTRKEELQDARQLLDEERSPSSKLYASQSFIAESPPMLVEGLMRERGVSVIYGDYDEFKTTLITDLMGHVAAGLRWQGREVFPRPVIWYALEGSEEVPLRLKALEQKFKGQNSPWGDDGLPVSVLDRIPEDYLEWRAEIHNYAQRWQDIYFARSTLGELPGTVESITLKDGKEHELTTPNYPDPDLEQLPPVLVIDTLSIALKGEDEKSAKAVEFINRCLDLLKLRLDLAAPFDRYEESEAFHEWLETNLDLSLPAASHIVIIHHETKTSSNMAGHRAIAADTQGLYRVHRFGSINDNDRPYAGQLTPLRVKGMARPERLRFEVEVVTVDGTKQTAAILKNKATDLPPKLSPVIKALEEFDDQAKLHPEEVSRCIDTIANNRTSRKRIREKLEAAGVLEPIEGENGKVALYCFHKP